MRLISRIASLLAIAALTVATMTATAGPQEKRYPTRNEDQPAANAEAAVLQVNPGDNVQDVIDRARPGDTIEIHPGTYYQQITIDFDDITLRGVVENGEMPIFDGKGEMNDAIMAAGNNFTIENIRMQNYRSNGVVVNQAKNVTFRNLVADATGKYGVYPVLSDGVLIEGCVVSNVWDAGIYAGQCKNVEIRNSEAFFNTIGIETENCVNVVIHNNTVHDNSLGILSVLLPDLPTEESENTLIVNNRVYNNNFPNLAPEGELVAGVQPGMGIVIDAANTNEVTRNVIKGHNMFGMSVYALTDVYPEGKEFNVEPNPDNNNIHHNVYADNGAGPMTERILALGLTQGYDLFWSAKGTGNTWDEPGATRFPPVLPGAQAEADKLTQAEDDAATGGGELAE